MRQLALVVCTIGLFACGGTDGDDAPEDAPTLSGDKYSLTWGPVTVPPGVEGTKCIWLRLGNTTEIKVHQLHNQLNDASHHLIVYKDEQDTTEQTTPIDCQPFTGAINLNGMISPIAITQKADDMIFLPEGVAYTFAANQMVKLEMHYLNRSDTVQEVTSKVDFYSADPATIQHEAAVLFTGSPDIDIPAGQTVTLHQFFQVPQNVNFSQSKIFAITGHTHQYGTSVKVNVAPSKTGPMTQVYAPNPFLWSEPETTNQATPFSIPVGGGLDFECTWKNTTNQAISFGESANEEMCFFWAYYYPSQGSKVCIHTDQFGGAGGINVCCPGDSLCSYVEDFLNN